MGDQYPDSGDIILGEGKGTKEVEIVGFLTALVKTEMVPLTRALADRGWQPARVTPVLKSAAITGWRKQIGGHWRYAFAMSFNCMGQALAAVEVMTFLMRCKPALVYLCGIAGSLKESELKIGDVVIGTDVHWQQQDKVEEVESEACDIYRSKKINLRNHLDDDRKKLIEMYVAERYQDRPLSGTLSNVYAGEVFTWDYVLSSKRRTKTILDTYPKAICVEMEAGGFMKAVERYAQVSARSPVEALVVRGVSD